MKRFIISFILIFILSISPIVSLIIYGNNQDNVYGESFYAELKEKVIRLDSIEDKKIVFIGGSSLSFGLRSDEIEKATGYKVVNFGLYASLGIKAMMELAEKSIKDGDIVILAPEISDETYSTGINYSVLNKCLENCRNYKNRLDLNTNVELFINLIPLIFEKMNADIQLNEPYTLSSFNEYCDIYTSVVSNNILYSLYDSGQMVKPSPNLLNNDFINYLNTYGKMVERKGARLFFSFSPTNKLSFIDDELINFENILKDKLKFEVLGTVEDFVYHEDYFYDTNYHLNYSGSLLHSSVLSKLINEKLGNESDYEISILPRPAPKYELDLLGEVQTDQLILNSTTNGYIVTGVNEASKNNTSIIIPNEIDGIKVFGVGDNAFNNMPNLEVVVFNKDINQIGNDLFIGSPKVVRVYLTGNPPSIVGNALLSGANSLVKIYVLKEKLSSYTIGYTWINYKKYFVTYEGLE